MNLLNQRCKIERATITKNEQRQTVKTWSTIKQDAPCNIQFINVTDNKYDQGVSGQMTKGQFIGFFENTQSLIKGDKITWSDISLVVDGIPLPVYGSGNTIHHKEVLLVVEET